MSEKGGSINLNARFGNSSSDQDSHNTRAELLVFQLNENWKKWSKTLASRDIREDQEKLIWTNATSAFRQMQEIPSGREYDAEVFRKIVDFCILMSGLGSAGSQPVVKETYLALSSVMKIADVARFLQQPLDARKDHLMELADIVMGIRLFNKDCRKGGAGIDDLPNVLPRASIATSSRLSQAFTAVKSLCSTYTSILSKIYYLNTRESETDLRPYLPPNFDLTDVEEIKSTLCLKRMEQHILSEISTELRSSDEHAKICVGQLRNTLLQLHGTLKFRSAVPTIQVYPLFIQLGVIWRELQYETATMSYLNRLIDVISQLEKGLSEPSLAEYFIKNRAVTAGLYEELPPSIDNQGSPIKLKGYCPWTLIQTGSSLLPGSVLAGGYAFRSSSAAENWFKDPDTSLANLQNVISCHRYLVIFFELPWPAEKDAPFKDEDVKPIHTAECGVQTELHPIPSYIDKSYAWSIWEMKRKAVHLTKIVGYVTKSQQTTISAFRASLGVQANPKVDKGCDKMIIE